MRIEPLEVKNAIVLKDKDSEVYYDMTSDLKVKEVNGVKFPHAIGIKSGPMNLDFVVQEIKVNEGVSDADFE